MTNEPETEVIPVDRFADLLPGDVVVETDRTYDGDLVRVRRVLPPKPKHSLPTTDGSIVVQSSADNLSDGRLATAFRLDGKWWSTEGRADRLYPEQWWSGWTLVYGAPARNLPTVREIDEVIRGGSESYAVVVDSSDAALRVWSFLKGRS